MLTFGEAALDFFWVFTQREEEFVEKGVNVLGKFDAEVFIIHQKEDKNAKEADENLVALFSRFVRTQSEKLVANVLEKGFEVVGLRVLFVHFAMQKRGDQFEMVLRVFRSFPRKFVKEDVQHLVVHFRKHTQLPETFTKGRLDFDVGAQRKRKNVSFL